jgi:hypothetical protein
VAIKRIRIDYTVYSPKYKPGEGLCIDFRTLAKAKSCARSLGIGSQVHRNFNQTNKRDQPLGDWWGDGKHWKWNGKTFDRKADQIPIGKSTYEIKFE